MNQSPTITATVSLAPHIRCHDCTTRIPQFKRMFLRDVVPDGDRPTAGVPICGSCFGREMDKREAAVRERETSAKS